MSTLRNGKRCTTQVEATKRQAEAWEELIAQIEDIELEGADDDVATGAGGAPDPMVRV